MTAIDRDGQERSAMSPLVTGLLFAIAAAALVRNRRPLERANAIAEAGSANAGGIALSERPRRSIWWQVKTVVLAVYNGINEHRVLAIAAGVAFYSLLAIFPALAALVSLYGLFANPHTITDQLNQAVGLLPGGAIDVIHNQLVRVASQRQGTLGLTFLVSLCISIWSANSGVKALFDALNVVRGESEKRSFLKLNALSLAFTTAAILFVIVAMSAVVVLPIALNFVGVSGAGLLPNLRWPALFLVTTIGLALVYRYGPCCQPLRWRWVSSGSVFAAILWIGASALFSWYTASFGSYNKTYGSLGAVIGFMTWLWISVIVILLGAELDAAIHGTRHDAPGKR
jgi:membrane protein